MPLANRRIVEDVLMAVADAGFPWLAVNAPEMADQDFAATGAYFDMLLKEPA